MAGNKLTNVKLGCSTFERKIMMYRHGKDANVSLEQREAEQDVFRVLIEYMLDGFPNGSSKEVRFGNNWYKITVKPIKKN